MGLCWVVSQIVSLIYVMKQNVYTQYKDVVLNTGRLRVYGAQSKHVQVSPTLITPLRHVHMDTIVF